MAGRLGWAGELCVGWVWEKHFSEIQHWKKAILLAESEIHNKMHTPTHICMHKQTHTHSCLCFSRYDRCRMDCCIFSSKGGPWGSLLSYSTPGISCDTVTLISPCHTQCYPNTIVCVTVYMCVCVCCWVSSCQIYYTRFIHVSSITSLCAPLCTYSGQHVCHTYILFLFKIRILINKCIKQFFLFV